MAPTRPPVAPRRPASATDEMNSLAPPRNFVSRSVAAGSIGTRAAEPSHRLRVEVRALVRKAAEDNASDYRRPGQRLDHGRNRDPRRAIGRKAIDAGGSGGNGNRSKAVGLAQFDGAGVARRQRVILAAVSPVPHRADGMNHMPCRKPVTPGDFGVAGRTAMQGAAFGEKLKAGRAMDGAIDATAAEQGGVGGVDDGVNA